MCYKLERLNFILNLNSVDFYNHVSCLICILKRLLYNMHSLKIHFNCKLTSQQTNNTTNFAKKRTTCLINVNSPFVKAPPYLNIHIFHITVILKIIK